MDSKRYILFLIGTLGLLRCGLAVGPGNWLSPACTSESPYTFEGSGDSINFPSKEWSIFNASIEASEAQQTYQISKEGDADYAVVGAGMLRFNDVNKNDTKAWLALGISKTATDAEQTPIELIPDTADGHGKIRFDNIYAKVRFVPSAELPNLAIEEGAMDLQEMYNSYADRNAVLDSDITELPKPVSAKLGLCVKDDGYFYITRVYTKPSSESTSGSTTGEEDAIKYEFVRSPVAYADVGGGTVIVRIEFQTYLGATEYDVPNRAYRIWVSAPDGTEEYCLSKGLGYRWTTTEELGYSFDFSSLEADDDCDWLFPMDQAYAGRDTIDTAGVDALHQLAFNATEGGFYSAWMATNLSIPDQNALAGYTLGAFESYAVPSASANFDAYAAWATSNNVDITEFLGTSEDTQAAFDAFLLNTSPEVLEETTVALSVTGIVTDADTNTVTITVRGPEGCDITNIPAAKLCVVRAATLGELAAAEPVEYTATRTAQQTLTVVLPDADKYPFMKACLLPKAE